MMAMMPGPPSDSYFALDDVPVTWQKSSCGRRIIQDPSCANLRSKRSTTRTLVSPNCSISHFATLMPRASIMREHSHSFSTEPLISMLIPPIFPRGSLRMCVVGVDRSGTFHRPSWWRSAVFSWAPAREIRKESSTLSLPAPRAVTPLRIASISASSTSRPSMLLIFEGAESSGKSWRAPTQSRPTSERRSKADKDEAL